MNRIKGVALAATFAMLSCLLAQPVDICGTTFERDGATVTVSCIDFDELAKLTKIPMSGKVTQFLIEPRNQDAYGVALVAKRPDDAMLLKAEPIYAQPDGKKRAMIVFDGFGWSIEHLQVIAKEKQ